jgi:hypothetical protein
MEPTGEKSVSTNKQKSHQAIYITLHEHKGREGRQGVGEREDFYFAK